MLCDRAELLAQELKELQAELGDYNTVMLTVCAMLMSLTETILIVRK